MYRPFEIPEPPGPLAPPTSQPKRDWRDYTAYDTAGEAWVQHRLDLLRQGRLHQNKDPK